LTNQLKNGLETD